EPEAPPVRWRGRSDGSYDVAELPADARAEAGTTVELTPRPGCEEWFAFDKVAALAREFGELLPHEVTAEDGAGRVERTTDPPPDWAFFVRCVIDTDSLRPTASREQLYDDDLLGAVREALGGQIRDWLTGLAAADPDRLAAFLRIHQLAVKALACHDDELFE